MVAIQKKPKSDRLKKSIAVPFFQKLIRDFGLLMGLGISVYLFLCLVSWSPNDPSLNYAGGSGKVANLGGWVGSLFADVMFHLFGNMAYLFLLLMVVLIWRSFRPRAAPGEVSMLSLAVPSIGFILCMVGSTALEQMYFPQTLIGSVNTAGGILGHFAVHGLSSIFGTVGVTMIMLVFFCIGLTMVTQISWLRLMDRTGYAAFALAGRVQALREARVDRLEGQEKKRNRKKKVLEIRAKSEQSPPRIEPRIQFAADPSPPRKEQQVTLFTMTEGGTLPNLTLLESPDPEQGGFSHEDLESMSRLLIKKLADFHVDVTVETVQPGPVITRFEIQPAPGVKASQIVGLSRDLARSLSVDSVRVVENISGKNTMGIEVPNHAREVVRLVEGLASDAFEKSKSPLTLVLGKDIAGKAVIADLAKMPHVLIAGTTGSGKSVCINALILSLVYKSTPDRVRLIMVDPKFLELTGYDGIPHLLAPVVTDMNKAANALRWCITEMDRRFRVMAEISVRNIAGYNKKVNDANRQGTPIIDSSIELGEDEDPVYLEQLPYIVVIVDELADLMMVAGKKIEEIIIRIAQRARAAGIHLVLATQRPSVDVVTGLIKANVPTRIAFQVSSRADSRTVLDQMGAETLLGQGDMLFLPPGTGFTQRVHGSFVSDDEVARVVEELKASGTPAYLDEIMEGGGERAGSGGSFPADLEQDGESDPLYDEAVEFVTNSRKASISSVQRALRVGYNRAARMIETMQDAGVVSAAENGKRVVLAPEPPED